MPNIQNLVMRENEDRTFTLYARDWNNAALSLSAAAISWRVGKSPYNQANIWPTLTKTGTVTDAANGAFTVSLSAADTLYIDGDYYHQAWATISGAQTVVAEGRLRIGSYIKSG